MTSNIKGASFFKTVSVSRRASTEKVFKEVSTTKQVWTMWVMMLTCEECVSEQCCTVYKTTLHTVLTMCSVVTMLLMVLHMIMPQEGVLKIPTEFNFTISSSGTSPEFGKLIPVYPDDLTLNESMPVVHVKISF